MPTIATVNTSDKVYLLAEKEAFKRKLGIGTAYTQMRMGLFATFVPTANADAACVTESVAFNTAVDGMYIGLKDSSDVLPGRAGARFIGLCFQREGSYNLSIGANSSGASAIGASSTYTGGGTFCTMQGWDGVTSKGYVDVSGANIGYVNHLSEIPQFAPGTVNRHFGFRLDVNNIGASNQSVTMYIECTHTAIADVSKASLKNQLLAGYYVGDSSLYTATPIPWNDGVSALPLPDYFYVRSPFVNNRIRISCYGGAKVYP